MMYNAHIDHGLPDECGFLLEIKIWGYYLIFSIFISRMKEIIDLRLSNLFFQVSLYFIEFKLSWLAIYNFSK